VTYFHCALLHLFVSTYQQGLKHSVTGEYHLQKQQQSNNKAMVDK
jgi:hypothetical protein